MKIYLGFTVAGNRSSVVAATKIVELLVELGHEVLTRHLIREDACEGGPVYFASRSLPAGHDMA
jgi:hypothetical protein